MRVSHTRPVVAARFDEPNLVSAAGLVPVMRPCAWDALGHLLWKARQVHDRTEHWQTHSRQAEADLPGDVVIELRRPTAPADPGAVRERYGWPGGADVAAGRTWRNGTAFGLPEALFAEIDAALRGQFPRPGSRSAYSTFRNGLSASARDRPIQPPPAFALAKRKPQPEGWGRVSSQFGLAITALRRYQPLLP